MSGATVNLPVSELMELKRKIDELETRVARSHGPRSNEEASTRNVNMSQSQSQTSENAHTNQAEENNTQPEEGTLSGNTSSTFHQNKALRNTRSNRMNPMAASKNPNQQSKSQ